jgi:hypothetical protein
MAYHLQVEDRDQAYLDGLRQQLSDRAHAGLDQFIEESICNITDDDRHSRQHGGSPGCFLTTFLVVDFFGDRRLHVIHFYVDDTNVAMGVLVLLFVDHLIGRPTIRQ